MFLAVHSYPLPRLEAGRKLGGCDSDPSKGGGRVEQGDGRKWQRAEDPMLDWLLECEREGGVLCWHIGYHVILWGP